MEREKLGMNYPERNHEVALHSMTEDDKEKLDSLAVSVADIEGGRENNYKVGEGTSLDRKLKQRHVEGEDRLKRALTSPNSLDIVIDCAYDDVHNDKERRSLIRQIQESYGNLRKDRSDVLTHLHVVNPPEQVREIMERWKITIHNSKEELVSFFDEISSTASVKKSLVYLSPDAPDILEVVDTKHVYLIGGIVDKTVKKCISLSHALQEEIECYRLPIREHISAQGSLALSIDTCVQILISYVQSNDWHQAFDLNLPDRKKRLV